MDETQSGTLPVLQAEVPLERDVFLRTLIRELAGSLESVVGLEEASGFISLVGQSMGNWIDQQYKSALRCPELSRDQVAAVLIDLKRRIKGDFYIIEETDSKIVFGNRACPFEDKVIGHPSMCMMTSNVFGAIAAEKFRLCQSCFKRNYRQRTPTLRSLCIPEANS